MKKQILFLLVCFGLIISGSGLTGALKAQNITKKTKRGVATTARVNTRKSQKPVPESKKISVRKIARNRVLNRALGDPCDVTVPISLGQSINGTFTGNDCLLQDGTSIDFYGFNGTAGQAVYISQHSDDVDSYLFLFDETGELIDENDDSGETLDSRIPGDIGVFILPYTGEYFIGANELDPVDGAYTVSLNTDAACSPTAIAYNQTVNGSLAQTDCVVNLGGDYYYTDLYTFSGTAGQQISIAQNSATIDSYLVLHSPSGDSTVEDDNGGGASNARIPVTSGLLTLPETGTYTIEASSSDVEEVGAYTLTLSGPQIQPTVRSPFDFDGDGKTDISIYRPSTSEWWYLRSSNGGNYAAQFGTSSDKLVPGDYTGDGRADFAVFRPSTGEWFILRSEDGSYYSFPFGLSGDIPAVGDFDGDGKADSAVFRPSDTTWYIRRSTDGGFTIEQFGVAGDAPVAADYDGDGKSDIAIWRASVGEWWIKKSSNSSVVAFQFGNSADKPVQGDYTGDGKADVAIWRPSTGEWFILRSNDFSYYSFPFGISTDVPAPGDYDGDGKFDATVFRTSDSNWYVQRTTAGTLIQPFGTTGDKPVPNAFVP